MYPTLQAFADTAVSNYFASIIVLADGDTPEAVKSPFFYGSANQAIWTSSDNLYFNDGKVYSTAQGPAWVTKSYGKWSYTWNLNVAALTSVDTTKASKTIAGRSYYDLNGRSVAVPGAGVYIRSRATPMAAQLQPRWCGSGCILIYSCHVITGGLMGPPVFVCTHTRSLSGE